MILDTTDPLLHRQLKMITEEQLSDYKNTLQPIASLLVSAIYEKNTSGISACQLGFDLAMFAMLTDDTVRICINPQIVAASFDMIMMQETCISFPDLTLKVRRPKGVMVRYLSIEGQETTERIEGETARIWLHEYDHCQGIVFTDRVGKLSLAMAKKRLSKRYKRKN